jgi:hypothetical protein
MSLRSPCLGFTAVAPMQFVHLRAVQAVGEQLMFKVKVRLPVEFRHYSLAQETWYNRLCCSPQQSLRRYFQHMPPKRELGP